MLRVAITGLLLLLPAVSGIQVTAQSQVDGHSEVDRGLEYKPAPTIIVDLDLPLRQRWNKVVEYYEATFPGYFEENNAKQKPEECDDFCHVTWLKANGEDAMEEVKGYADHAGIDYRWLMLSNVGYELNFPRGNQSEQEFLKAENETSAVNTLTGGSNPVQGCSGVLATMENGTVVHGRNMDYKSKHMYHNKTLPLADLTVEILYMKNGKPLMTSVNWPLQLGCATCMRFTENGEAWSVQQNTRARLNDMNLNVEAVANDGGKAFGFLLRYYMEKIPDFETALKTISETSWMAPQYFILAGAKPYQGAIVTAERGTKKKALEVQRLLQGHNMVATKEGIKYLPARRHALVQTNDDLNDYPLDPRRYAAMQVVYAIPNSMTSEDEIMTIMRSQVLNVKFTVFSSVWAPFKGTHQLIRGNRYDSPGTSSQRLNKPQMRPVLAAWESKNKQMRPFLSRRGL